MTPSPQVAIRMDAATQAALDTFADNRAAAFRKALSRAIWWEVEHTALKLDDGDFANVSFGEYRNLSDLRLFKWYTNRFLPAVQATIGLESGYKAVRYPDSAHWQSEGKAGTVTILPSDLHLTATGIIADTASDQPWNESITKFRNADGTITIETRFFRDSGEEYTTRQKVEADPGFQAMEDALTRPTDWDLVEGDDDE